MAAAVVAAEGVVKTYGEGRAARRVLDGASLHVEAGEVVAILGRSGTGKSTFLHLIGGLDRCEAGTITVAGERVTGAGERALSRLRRQRIGFVFQFFHLLPELTARPTCCWRGASGRRSGRASRAVVLDRRPRAAPCRRLAATSSPAASSSASRSPAR